MMMLLTTTTGLASTRDSEVTVTDAFSSSCTASESEESVVQYSPGIMCYATQSFPQQELSSGNTGESLQITTSRYLFL